MARKRIYFAEFRRSLDTEPLKPVYLFTGAEAFLKEQGVQAIVDKALPPAERSMNLEYLYAGTDVSGLEVKERALTMPFFTASRVLVVRQAEKWRTADTGAVSDYADQPSSSSVLVIVSQEERLKQEHWKTLASKAYHVECYPLFDNQVPSWVERQAGQHGKRINREAITLLIERIGQNLADLDSELAKLATYTGQNPSITEKDVQTVAGHTRLDSLHELNAALGKRRAGEAFRLAGSLLDEGVAPAQLLNNLLWHFRTLLSRRTALDQGADQEKILADIRNPQARQEMAEQLKSFQRQEYDSIFREFLRLDEQIKYGKPHWDLLLQTAILRICKK